PGSRRARRPSSGSGPRCRARRRTTRRGSGCATGTCRPRSGPAGSRPSAPRRRWRPGPPRRGGRRARGRRPRGRRRRPRAGRATRTRPAGPRNGPGAPRRPTRRSAPRPPRAPRSPRPRRRPPPATGSWRPPSGRSGPPARTLAGWRRLWRAPSGRPARSPRGPGAPARLPAIRDSARMRLRSHLVLLVVAVLVPVTAFAAILTALNIRDQRAAVERALAETAAALALAVDRELEGAINTLQTLATSPEVQRHDVARLYAYAQRTRAEAHPGWASIALADRSGRIAFSTSTPLGAPQPSARDREFFQRVLATRRPVASDLIPGEAAGEQVVVVAIPVLARDGGVTGVLLASIPPSAWS